MGVLNVTPDSFSDGGRYLDPARALEHARAMVAAGADIIDVGGESSRPGSAGVPAAEELARVLPVIHALASELDLPISVDTWKAEVAREALAAGATIVNDIGAAAWDPRMVDVLAGSSARAILMHALDRPDRMQQDPRYGDVVSEVADFLAGRMSALEAAGVARERLYLDPGIGFGKTPAHNLELLAGLDRLAALGRPLVIGTSNKSFLGQITGRPLPERTVVSAVSAALAAHGGAHVVRVHDVAAARDAVRYADALRAVRKGRA